MMQLLQRTTTAAAPTSRSRRILSFARTICAKVAAGLEENIDDAFAAVAAPVTVAPPQTSSPRRHNSPPSGESTSSWQYPLELDGDAEGGARPGHRGTAADVCRTLPPGLRPWATTLGDPTYRAGFDVVAAGVQCLLTAVGPVGWWWGAEACPI
ncbi:hypothetical protein PG994_001054 [Apiospora phragmitis]|uniref:Uncharacterized protein n=1 Tax=Apiospora phragmitis TaxID=2905665 RepID=A0ABR1WSF3_9PEZI